MKYFQAYFRRLGIVLFGVIFLSLSTTSMLIAQDQGPYPEPRFPKWMAEPTKDDLLKAARYAVRQTEGYSTLGNAEKGMTVHVFTDYRQDMDVWNAIKQAWAERGVEAVLVHGWEVMDMSEDEYKKRAEANMITAKDGWKEYGVFDPIYMPYIPSDIQEEIGQPLAARWKAQHEIDYGRRPEVKYLFVGEGGGGRREEDHAGKFLGNWVYWSKSDLLMRDSMFPSDVWKMVDEHIVRAIPYVSEGTFHDPEGTRLHWTLTPQQSQNWDKESGLSSYGSGHLNVYPPPPQATWKEGVIVAGGNHTGFMPSMEVHISEHGRITEIKGGGKSGDVFRGLYYHPKFYNADFPSAPEKGYWYLKTDGFGTNPKAVRNMERLVYGTVEKANLIERRRAGVQHFSFASPAGPERGDIGAEDIAYAKQLGVPISHTAHMHVYFGTLKWRLRDTGEWVTLSEKGMVKAFENPEVRALAARYGEPDVIFSYDWVPAIPGINYPGDYEDNYAPDPAGWLARMWNRIKDGSYEYYVEDYEMFDSDTMF